jgi:RNA polymerase II subunit A small phosphatase-like protein
MQMLNNIMVEKSNKLLILDLDETLIHATETKLEIVEDFRYEQYYVYKRPNLNKFLEDVSKHFTVGIWSSADDDYVKEIVQRIIPETMDLKVVWGRSRCSVKRDYDYDQYNFEKRLDKLKKQGFRLEQIILVDDSPEKTRSNYGNAIYIKEFLGEQNDQELKFLFDYLLTLKEVENIRTMEKRGWRKL